MITGNPPASVDATQLVPRRNLRSELRATGLRLNDVDQRRRVSSTQRSGLDAELLHCLLIKRRAIQAGLARDGLQIAELALRRRLIRSYSCDRSRLLTVRRGGTLSRAHFNWSVYDSTYGGAELEVRAELRAESQRSERPANCFGFRLLEVVPEISRGLAAPAGCRSTTRNRDHGAEDRGIVAMRYQLRLDRRVRVLIAHPDQTPLYFEVVGSTNARQVSRGLKRGRHGHWLPPSIELLF